MQRKQRYSEEWRYKKKKLYDYIEELYKKIVKPKNQWRFIESMNYVSDSLKSEVKLALENTNDNALGIDGICQINLNLTRWCN